VLGRPRHFAFRNLARDDHLPPDHWFWDSRTSGGIFVEHGVHFFDAAAWLLGSHPMEVQALEVARGGHGPINTSSPTRNRLSISRPCWTEASRHAVVSGWIPLELQLEAWTGPDAAALLAARQAAASGQRVAPPAFPRTQ
jgi:predicted dehydrogenase